MSVAAISTMSIPEMLNELPLMNSEERKAVARRLRELKSQPGPRPAPTDKDKEAWAKRLEALRKQFNTGRTGTPLQQIFDDLRADR